MTKRDILNFFFKWKALIFSLFILIVFSVTLFVYIIPPAYTGKAKVLVEPNRSPAMRTDMSPSLEQGEAVFTEIEIILSYAVMSAVVDKLKPYAKPPKEKTYFGKALKMVSTTFEELGLTLHMEPRDRWIRHLLKNVAVKPVKTSSILEIIYKDKNPEWAALIVNEVIDSYIQHHFSVYMASGSSKLYKGPMERSEKIVERRRQELLQFKKKHSIAAIKEKKIGLTHSISSLREKLTNSQVSLAELTVKYKLGHPGYQEVLLTKSKIRQLKSSVLEAHNDLKNLEIKSDHVLALEQEIESRIRTYEDHKKKYEDARVAELSNLDFINIRVIDYSPVPVRPDHSNLFYIAISIIVGLIFSVTIALIREYFDRRVTDPGEVERILGIPEMGSLEKFDNR